MPTPSSHHRILLSLFAAGSLLAAVVGCSGPIITMPEQTAPTGPIPQAPEPTETGAPASGGDAERPRLFFTAHGEGAPNTFGPACAMGIETTASNLMRVTAPEGWVYRGSSGGTGPSELRFDVGGVTVTVNLLENAEQLGSLLRFDGYELGGRVGAADLDGTTFPVVEASLSGDATGHAMTDVPWLTNLPSPWDDGQKLTVFVTSQQAGVPSLNDSLALLASVRVERCGGIMQAVIAMSVSRLLAVPDIVNDPLGKTVPSSPQPAYDVQAGPNAWSAEQLAYLLPFPEPTDRCVADVLQDQSVRDTLPQLLFIGPFVVGASGTNLEALEEIAAGC